MSAIEEINYGLIGEFLTKCAALEFEVDFLLFVAANEYKETMTDQIKNWPQQASDKCETFMWLINDLMKFPPNLIEHGFDDITQLAEFLDRVYHVRNLLCHGTPVQRFGPDIGLHLSKVTRLSGNPLRFTFDPEFISEQEIENLTSTLDGEILIADAAMFSIRREHGGWLHSDTSNLPPVIKLDLISRRMAREKMAARERSLDHRT